MKNRGTILIFALWALAFLAVIAAQLSTVVRQRITVLERLNDRIELRYLAQAGVRKAVSFLKTYAADANFFISPGGKELRSNNPLHFSEIQLGTGRASVFYWDEDLTQEPVKKFGMMEEAAKLNLNTATAGEVERLLILGLKMDGEEARSLALALTDWRSPGDNELTGFYSDEYYANLQFPYRPKEAAFETWDELLLVRGMNEGILRQMRRFFTIYGDGKININTAPWQVMAAVGLSEELAIKIIAVRRGPDGVDTTADDYAFLKSYDAAAELSQVLDLTTEETEQIDAWNISGKLSTGSLFYSIQSEARLDRSQEKKVILCVFNIKDDKIEYWREE